MSLFQHSVLNKYLQGIDENVVNDAWEKFTTYFHKPERQDNIRNIKEEEYGIDFLIKFFVNILGYTKNPDPNYNLQAEKKNLTDSKKADGAILQDEKVIGVIEFKGMDTTDLGGKVEIQAFGYKNHQPDSVYVITSNFEKLRFYIDNAVDFEEFNLFQLTQERFKILWLCLAKENVFKGIPKKIKDESLEEEELITKKLYKDYSTFKHEIFNSIIELNPQYDKLLLFKKTQKLLDRFLFIFFAEDRLLLPPNSIRNIIKQWRELKENYDEHFPLYDRYKKYFGYMNTGYKGKEHTVFAYNGGLFKTDNILDEIKIDDEVLYKHSLKLSHYDFESEVSVNILGHIFEHSLNEIEEITAELEEKEVDKSKTKRKKDGVYYTPKYITKYIVENTVGKLCEEKKIELGIIEAEYEKERKGRRKTTLKTLQNKLEKYRKWLLELTICDPACGSGAFLIQALDFLINEHRYIDELNRKLLGHSIEFPNVEKSILENNLYGVDINDEAVEIAKLSLWLRTAQKGRKLTTLSNNIKCGNSLIDDIEVAGEKAFNWESKFPEIFNKGGFDVVIGNPPYVRQELITDIKSYLTQTFDCYNSIADLYTYFIELGIKILNSSGKVSLIVPNKFLKATYGKNIRQYILENSTIDFIYNFDDYPIFKDSTTYPIIFVFDKTIKNNKYKFYYSEINRRIENSDPIVKLLSTQFQVSTSTLSDDNWNFINVKYNSVFNKINNNSISLSNFVDKKIFRGITTGKNDAFIIDSKTKADLIRKNPKTSGIIKKVATGKEIKRNYFDFQDRFLLFTGYDTNIPVEYPEVMGLLDKQKKALIKRYDKGENYWNLRACAYYDDMQKPKIVYPRINNRCNFYLDNEGELFLLDNNFFIASGDRSLLALLNSKLIFFFIKNICTTLQGGFYDFRRDKILTVPISNNLDKFADVLGKLADKNISLNNSYQKLITNFINRLKDNFDINTISKKLESFFLYDFSNIINELKKQKISFKLREQDEWSGYFEDKKEKINQLQLEIDKTDREIDLMVYKLYGLTEREIMIVEGKE